MNYLLEPSAGGLFSVGRSSIMAAAVSRSLPFRFSQTPKMMNGRIVATAQSFALRGSFASGSQRKSSEEMTAASKAQAAADWMHAQQPQAAVATAA